MRFKKIISLSFNSLIHSKLRSWLTIIGIIIGVSSFIAILALGQGMESDINNKMGGMQLDIINVTPGYFKASDSMRGFKNQRPTTTTDDPLTDKDIQIIKSIKNVEVISPEISGSQDIYYLSESISKNITGVAVTEWLKITDIELTTGRMLGPTDYYSILIGDKIAEDNFTEEIGVNRLIQIENKSFRVIGIIKDSSSIYISFDAALEVIEDKESDEYDKITVKVESEEAVDLVAEEIDEKLMLSRHIIQEKDKDFTVTAIKDAAENINEMTNSMILFLGVIAAISLVVGAVGIANTMFTSVLEKTKEIGIMKSIGAGNNDILLLFIFNSALYGVVGGIFGVLLGGVISSALGNLLGFGMMRGATGSMTLGLALWGILLAIGISVLSGIIPAYRASRLKPVDALRYE